MKRIIHSTKLSNLFSRRNLGESKLRFHNMERNLRRLKNKKYPKRPTTAGEIIDAFQNPSIVQEFGLNLRADNRFYVDTIVTKSNSSFTIFASYPIIEMIKKNILPNERKYLLDGTFDVTPFGHYYQLLVIYIEYQNDVGLNFIFFEKILIFS